MNKTGILIISIFILVAISTGYLFFTTSNPEEAIAITTKNKIIKSPQLPSLTIIPTEVFKLIFIESGAYIQEIHKEYNCKTTVNGSYFGINPDGTFFPAGIRLQSGIDRGKQNTSDPNLQEYLEIDEERSSIIHIKPEEVGREQHKLYINAGPLLVKEGEINAEISQNISHRNQSFPRTILLIAEGGQPFLYISPQKTTLYSVAKSIVNIEEYGKMTAINLDSGPSTAIYEEISPKEGIGGNQFYLEEQLLPIFFCLQRGTVKT